MARSTGSSSERPDSSAAGLTRAYLDYASFSPVDPRAVGRALTPDTALVSIQAANGEVGTVQALGEIGRLVHRHGAAFHVDGVGAVGRLGLTVDGGAIDLLSLSSNDLYGPPGAGA